MSDSKSKFPDFKEISTMTSKFFKDIKNSIEEIIGDYKKKRDEKPAPQRAKPEHTKPHTATTKTTVEKTPAETKIEKTTKTTKPRKPKEETKD